MYGILVSIVMVTNFSKLSHPVVVGKDDNNDKDVVSRDLIKVSIFNTALNKKTIDKFGFLQPNFFCFSFS